ncbi:glycosyltransferase family 2 protein [Erythrobacter sp. NE805]|uniref:glycosyltransferase family 2 protein n=1 Tax=Erythrobacter sp. NE805 TaxID=3389875 RepID=UPI00396B19DE
MTDAPEHAVPAVSILIVAYNSRGFIADCIGSVIEHTAPGSYEILLVDNGKDDTAGFVAERFPAVRIIPGQGNIGFGRGNNLIAQHARGEYLLLLNPDTRLVDPAIDRLLAFARTRGGAAWGGLTTYPDGTLDGGNFLAIPTLSGIVQSAFGLTSAVKTRSRIEQLAEPVRVDVLCGGFAMIARSAWDALGGFDPSFLLYSEEIDLFARLKRIGGEVWLTPEVRIIHDVGSGNSQSAARMRFLYTGLMHYARRHWQGLAIPVIGVAYWIAAFRRWLVSVLLGPVSGFHRARRRALAPIVLEPGVWWRGYEGRASLD